MRLRAQAPPKVRLRADEIAGCSEMAAGVLSRQLSPAILTYTTSRPSKNWLLGLTAASHGLPIVVAGLGRSAFGFGSTAPRVMGYLRALQIMDSAAPGSIAVVTDSTDTVVVNAADAATSAGRALERAKERGDPQVLSAAECGSWPKCYAPLYAHDATHQQCRAEGNPTCFANAGAYLGATSPLMAMFDEQVRMLARLPKQRTSNRGGLKNVRVGAVVRNHSIGGSEMADDQAMLHYQYLNQSQSNLSFSLRMDVHSSFFLSTWTCRDRVFPRVHTVFGPWQRCHEMKHEPAAQVLAPVVGGSSMLRYNASDGTEQRPFLLHANGKDNFLKPSRVRANPRLRHLDTIQKRMQQPSDDLLRHPVLLLDTPGALCRVTSLAELLHPNPNSTGEVSKIPSLVSALPSLAPIKGKPESGLTRRRHTSAAHTYSTPQAVGPTCCAGSREMMVQRSLMSSCGGDERSKHICQRACCSGGTGCCFHLFRCSMGGAGGPGICADTTNNPEFKAARQSGNYAHFMLTLAYPLLMATEARGLRDGVASELLLAVGKLNPDVLQHRRRLQELLGPNATCMRAQVSQEELHATCGIEQVPLRVHVPTMGTYNRSFYARANAFADLVSKRFGFARTPLIVPTICEPRAHGLTRIVFNVRGNTTGSQSRLERMTRQIFGLSQACDPTYAVAAYERTGAQLECVSLGRSSSLHQNARAFGGHTIALVGGHGAGLANLLFLRPGAMLFEIDSVLNVKNDRNMYQLLADAIGVVPTKVWLDLNGRHYGNKTSTPVRFRISPKRPNSTGGWLKGAYSASVRLMPSVLDQIVSNATRDRACAPDVRAHRGEPYYRRVDGERIRSDASRASDPAGALSAPSTAPSAPIAASPSRKASGTIADFLTHIKLQSYIDTFNSKGYNDLEYLRELDAEALNRLCLKVLQMKAGHAQKFVHRLHGK